MATQVLTRVLCDFCMADDKEVDGRRLSIALDGTEYQLDVCESHAVPLDALAATLAEHAVKVGKHKPNGTTPRDDVRVPEKVTCPDPDCGRSFANRASLGDHARRVHAMTVGELEGKPLSYACDVCPRAFTSPQGLAVHKARVHA